MSKVKSGVVAVSAIVAVKLLAKTAIFAALFGGATVANNMYESRVTEVKNQVAEYNRTHAHNDSYMLVEESNRKLIEVDTIPTVHRDQIAGIDPDAMSKAMQETKQEAVKTIVSTKDVFSNYFLIQQGWTQTIRYTSAEGDYIAQVDVVKGDL
ncbi:hypothetical protein IS360_003589 [Salmonella enterica]|nr:hypothetical protein [Salmonella enterica]EGW0579052.1 hypothetical protein [Salmonella enterica]